MKSGSGQCWMCSQRKGDGQIYDFRLSRGRGPEGVKENSNMTNSPRQASIQ